MSRLSRSLLVAASGLVLGGGCVDAVRSSDYRPDVPETPGQKADMVGQVSYDLRMNVEETCRITTNLQASPDVFYPLQNEVTEIIATISDKVIVIDVHIVDSQNEIVKKFPYGNEETQSVSVIWDGMDDSGKIVVPGRYTTVFIFGTKKNPNCRSQASIWSEVRVDSGVDSGHDGSPSR